MSTADWRSAERRNFVISKIAETILNFPSATSNSMNPREIENTIFIRANNEQDYLNTVGRVMVSIRNRSTSMQGNMPTAIHPHSSVMGSQRAYPLPPRGYNPQPSQNPYALPAGGMVPRMAPGHHRVLTPQMTTPRTMYQRQPTNVPTPWMHDVKDLVEPSSLATPHQSLYPWSINMPPAGLPIDHAIPGMISGPQMDPYHTVAGDHIIHTKPIQAPSVPSQDLFHNPPSGSSSVLPPITGRPPVPPHFQVSSPVPSPSQPTYFTVSPSISSANSLPSIPQSGLIREAVNPVQAAAKVIQKSSEQAGRWASGVPMDSMVPTPMGTMPGLNPSLSTSMLARTSQMETVGQGSSQPTHPELSQGGQATQKQQPVVKIWTGLLESVELRGNQRIPQQIKCSIFTRMDYNPLDFKVDLWPKRMNVTVHPQTVLNPISSVVFNRKTARAVIFQFLEPIQGIPALTALMVGSMTHSKVGLVQMLGPMHKDCPIKIFLMSCLKETNQFVGLVPVYQNQIALQQKLLQQQIQEPQGMQQSQQPGLQQQRTQQQQYDLYSSSRPSDQNLPELLSVIESLKKQSLSLQFRLVKFIFTGTPRVGKSTLKKRIMKEIVNLSDQPEVNPSTGLEKPCVVQVPLGDSEAERAAFIISHTSDENLHAWKNQHLDEQISILFDSMLEKKVSPLESESGDKPISPQASEHEDDVASNPPGKTNPVSPSSPAPPSSPALSSSPSLLIDVGTIAQDINWTKAKKQLALIQETTSVYMMDTGGQPEFHEVLPFVLQGPALHLVFFSLLEDKEGINCLDRQFEVEYVSEKETSTDPYKSVYPVKEVLFQLLASFHSLHKSETDSQRLANADLSPSLHTPQAILIGTYKDKFIKEKNLSQQQQCLDQVNQKLITTFKESEFYTQSFLSTVPPNLQCAGTSNIDGDRFYVAMDNMCGTREEMDLFRTFLTNKIFEVAGPIELPCSVLLFHLLLRYKYEAKPGICTIEECKELAEKCQIAGADVTKVLKYLHITLGTILYYEDIPSLKGTVFCDPNVLLSQINQLIAVCFTCNPTMKTMASRTRETGVIEPALWNHVCSCAQYQGAISNKQVIDFLQHYKLMIEIESEQGLRNWFMPCLLLPNPEVATISTGFLESLTVCPLLFRFSGNIVPLGQFTALIVRLCLKQWDDAKPWELAANTKRYRNQVTFLTGIRLQVRLTARPQFIEVMVEESSISCMSNKEELQAFCITAMQHIVEAIKETQTGHKFEYGFYCPGSWCLGQSPHYAKARSGKGMRSSNEKEFGHCCCSVPPQGFMWLQEPKLTTTDGLISAPSLKTSFVSSITESTLLPLTENFKCQDEKTKSLEYEICKLKEEVESYKKETKKKDAEIQRLRKEKQLNPDHVFQLQQELTGASKKGSKRSMRDVSESEKHKRRQPTSEENTDSEELVEVAVAMKEKLLPKKRSQGYCKKLSKKLRNDSREASSENRSTSHSDSSGLSSLLDSEPMDSDLRRLVAPEILDSLVLGLELNLEYTQIKMFSSQEKEGININMRILTTWIRSETKMPTTWRTLIEALHSIKAKKLARKITNELEQRERNGE